MTETRWMAYQTVGEEAIPVMVLAWFEGGAIVVEMLADGRPMPGASPWFVLYQLLEADSDD